VAVFTLPKEFLEKDITFFIAAYDDSIASAHRMPNGVTGKSVINFYYKAILLILYFSGFSEIADDTLRKLYHARDKKKVESANIPIIWNKDSKLFPVFSTTKCTLNLSCISAKEA